MSSPHTSLSSAVQGGLLVILVAQRRPGAFAGMVLMSPLLGVNKPYYTRFTAAHAHVSAVELPFLLQYGTGDKVCDPQASGDFFEKAPSRDKSQKIYEDAYHTLLEEPDGVAQQVLKDIIDWLCARLPPRTSTSSQPGTSGQQDSAMQVSKAATTSNP
ncbi:hypothetical protein HPB49_023543 [Dermacentor silvarum]|uniref:Uncharacterized protein n=1 Tax=Dermacentor silvarum TaxID=543639 RepID=A0ACB8DS05_DERSI|nr:hypothetical protein HPB49_023543 [Dermacentor silvarum]